MYRIEIPAKLWAACGAAVSTEESRPILNGIQLQRHDTHGVACATNGHALVAGRWALENDGTREIVWPDGEVIVPFVKLSAVGVTARAMDSAVIVLTSNGIPDSAGVLAWHATALMGGKWGGNIESGKSVKVYPIDGPFPNWRQVVPTGDPTPAHTFGVDPNVIAQACDVLGKCTLTLYGEERGMVARPTDDDIGFQAFALAMPLRVHPDHKSGTPEWL